jgi:hypothetical protein
MATPQSVVLDFIWDCLDRIASSFLHVLPKFGLPCSARGGDGEAGPVSRRRAPIYARLAHDFP